MKNAHGIIYAHHGYAALGALGAHRTGASMPFSGRFRLIDFALSSMMNAGIHDVGVIMQKGYQSLLDHVSSGRAWDMARHVGGLSVLPPYGLPRSSKGVYEGNMEALNDIREYLEAIRQEYIVLERGDLAASVDIEAVMKQHLSSGVDITAVCTDRQLPYMHHSYLVGPDGLAKELLCMVDGSDDGYNSLEMYILKKDLLLEIVEWCAQRGRLHFHRDALMHLMRTGRTIGVYLHKEYARHIVDVGQYYEANMDMLDPDKRSSLFPKDRKVLTPSYIDVSTYYGSSAKTKNSIVADGCIIEGSIENCVLFSGAKIGPGAVLKNCIVLNDTEIGEGSKLDCVIADKNIIVSPHTTMAGTATLPIVIPKGSKV